MKRHIGLIILIIGLIISFPLQPLISDTKQITSEPILTRYISFLFDNNSLSPSVTITYNTVVENRYATISNRPDEYPITYSTIYFESHPQDSPDYETFNTNGISITYEPNTIEANQLIQSFEPHSYPINDSAVKLVLKAHTLTDWHGLQSLRDYNVLYQFSAAFDYFYAGMTAVIGTIFIPFIYTYPDIFEYSSVIGLFITLFGLFILHKNMPKTLIYIAATILVPLITLYTLKAIIFAQYGSHGIGLLYTSIYWAIFLVIWLIAVTRIFQNYKWYSHFFTTLFGVLLGIKIILYIDTAEIVMALAILIISLGLIVGFTSRKFN